MELQFLNKWKHKKVKMNNRYSQNQWKISCIKNFLLVQCKIYQKISIGESDSIKTIKKINKIDYFSIKWHSSFIKELLGKVVNFNKKANMRMISNK